MSVLFVEKLEHPDLRRPVKEAVEKCDTHRVTELAQGALRVISLASRRGTCCGDMRLDNFGVDKIGKVVACDLGGAPVNYTRKAVNKSLNDLIKPLRGHGVTWPINLSLWAASDSAIPSDVEE